MIQVDEAEEACRSNKMHLVSILDSRESNLVLDIVRENNVSVIGSYVSMTELRGSSVRFPPIPSFVAKQQRLRSPGNFSRIVGDS